MLKNYSDHTISFKVGRQYIEIPPGWSDDTFADDPELEEFLRNRYSELREPQISVEEPSTQEKVVVKKKKSKK